MAAITVPASGDTVEIVSAPSTNAIVQNVGTYEVVVENAADPSAGLGLKPGQTLNLGKTTAWTAAWNAISPSHRDVVVRVAHETAIEFLPPAIFTVEGDTPLAGQFQAEWVPNTFADTTDFQWRVDNGSWNVEVSATSPHVELGPFTSGQKIDGQVRSVSGGVDGPWSTIVSTAIA